MREAESIVHDMVEFEARWYRYGGGPSAEIYTQFGMDERTFFERLNTVVESSTALEALAPNDAEVMRAVIRRRLWLAS